MKNNLLILFLFFSIFSFGQIPNNGFEIWEDVGKEKLSGWFSYGRVDKSLDASDGNSALRVDNDTVPGLLHLGAVTNSLEQDLFKGGEKYEETPLSFVFDAKFDLAPGDTAQVLVFFTVESNPLASLDFRFSGTSADTFKRFSIPIIWGVFTPPDTILVILSSNIITKTASNGPGYVIYDNILLESVNQEHGKISNASFETFDPSGIEVPTGWYTSDLFVNDVAADGTDVNSVIQSTQAHHSVSMLLQNVIYQNNILPGVAVTGDKLDLAFPPAFPMTGKFDYLQGYYQFIPENGDVGSITTLLYLQGNVIGSGQLDFVTSVDTIGYFSVPITYFAPVTPDSATIFISCADIDDPLGENTKLWIDKLSYSNNVASVNHPVFFSEVFPNPATSTITLKTNKNISHYEIQNSLGQLVYTTSNKNIDVSTLNKGAYTLRAHTGNSVIISKFIKL